MSLPVKASIFAVALALFVGVFVWAAVVSDFHEMGLMLLGGFGILGLLSLTWSKAPVWLVGGVVTVSVVGCVALAMHLKSIGDYKRIAFETVSRNTMIDIAGQLVAWRDDGGEIPDCPYACMKTAMTEAGRYRPITLAFEDGSGPIEYKGMPFKDPWACRYSYRKTGEGAFIITSSGADRRFDTQDDILVSSSLLPTMTKHPIKPWHGFLPVW
ncbi:MAG: hypothetical protein H6685_12600 [Deltaproteobacteria bacterium]|nr:hypothetical protein [Deltaproteobacteria bacterium]